MTEKQDLRQAIKQKRDAIPPEKKKELDRLICARIAKTPQFQNATAVLFYAPIGSEVNLFPLVKLAQSKGKKIAFPRCDTNAEEMHFFELLPNQKLTRGAYSIPEPPADAPLLSPDSATLCILPALACDLHGNRLGYGKGYYDKFLASFPGIPLCALYHAFVAEELPHDEWDIPVLWICTERACIAPGDNVATADAAPPKKGISAIWNALQAGAKRTRNALRAADAAKPLHQPPLLVLSCFLLLLLSGLVRPMLDRESRYAGVAVFQILIFLIPALVYTKLKKDSFFARIRMRPPRISQLWFILCILVMMVTGGLLCEILTGGISSLGDGFSLYEQFSAQPTGSLGANLAMILAYALLPAFCEELIFRSILCAEYEGRGAGVALLASALFFAMLHGSFPHFLTYFLLGLFLAGAFYVTKSFWTVFALHLFYNLFCLFGQPYLSAFYVTAGSSQIFIFCLVVLFLLFAAFAAGEARKIYHLYAKANADSSYTVALPIKRLPTALFGALRSPVTLGCILLFLVVAILNLF